MTNRAINSSKEINNNMMINISKKVIEKYLDLIVEPISLIRKNNKEEEEATTVATTRVAATEAIKREAIEILDSTISSRETMKITLNIPRNIKNIQENKFHKNEGISIKILATNSKRHYITLFFNGMILYVIQSISKV